MLVGAAPFALIFGTLAVPSHVAAGTAFAMSVLVFAGSAQFIALTLTASGSSLGVILLTTFVVNLRHALYSATLRPHVVALPLRWRIALAFGLTDETFAVVQRKLGSGEATADGHWYFLGSVLAMYLNWVLWTAVGLGLGRAVSGLQDWGLSFALVATFTAIVAPALKQMPQLLAALAAGGVALLAHGLPYKLDLILATAAGVLVGTLVQARREQRSTAAVPS
jgi:4-azaleucine resistance transporter AzlC